MMLNMSMRSMSSLHKGLDEAIRSLQEVIPSASVDFSLSTIENLNLFIKFLKEYFSRLKSQIEAEIEAWLERKNLVNISRKCTKSQKKVIKCLREVQDYVEEARNILSYCMKWSNIT